MAKKLNIFATSSSDGFLKCLKAPEGHVIVASDINSLEPHVLAHFSQEPGYLKIYHKSAAPNCIYLYLGAHSPQHGHLFRSVYDAHRSTKESVDAAKKLYANERQRYKVCVLALAYEGTEAALDRMFKKYKMVVPWSELTELVRLFKRTFPGLKEFKAELQAQWRANGGYILTGRGRPLPIPRDEIDAVIANFCQATGHDYVMRWLYHMQQYRERHKLQCKPFIPDYHDATYFTAPDTTEGIESTKAMIKYGYDALNDELGLDVLFKGDIKVSHSMNF